MRVRDLEKQEVAKITGIGPEEFYELQTGTDAATKRYVKGNKLELVSRPEQTNVEPGFFPERSITDVGY